LIGLGPLIILSPDGKREIMRVTADGNGNYRATLPPGDYSRMSKTAGVGMSAPYRNRSQYWQIKPSMWMAIDYGRSLISEPAASHPTRLTATTA
jgi:hypothetical protein